MWYVQTYDTEFVLIELLLQIFKNEAYIQFHLRKIMNSYIKKITLAGVFSALAIILVTFIRFSIFPAVSFLEYDPADIPIFLATSILGPIYGIAMTIVVSILQGITVSSQSGAFGILMHIVATGSFVAAQGLVLLLFKKKGRADKLSSSLIAVIAGICSMTIIMIPFNLIITPIFMGVSRGLVLQLLPYILAFNLIKASINGFVFLAISTALKPIIKKQIN